MMIKVFLYFKLKLEISTLKVLESGDIIINDFNSWDLIVLGPDFYEKGRLEGLQHPAPGILYIFIF